MTWVSSAVVVMVTVKCVGRAMLAGETVDLPPCECHGRRKFWSPRCFGPLVAECCLSDSKAARVVCNFLQPAMVLQSLLEVHFCAAAARLCCRVALSSPTGGCGLEHRSSGGSRCCLGSLLSQQCVGRLSKWRRR